MPTTLSWGSRLTPDFSQLHNSTTPQLPIKLQRPTANAQTNSQRPSLKRNWYLGVGTWELKIDWELRSWESSQARKRNRTEKAGFERLPGSGGEQALGAA